MGQMYAITYERRMETRFVKNISNDGGRTEAENKKKRKKKKQETERKSAATRSRLSFWHLKRRRGTQRCLGPIEDDNADKAIRAGTRPRYDATFFFTAVSRRPAPSGELHTPQSTKNLSLLFVVWTQSLGKYS